MTIREVANQLYHLSLDGHINGEKFSKRELEATIRRWMERIETSKIPNRFVIEICMQDGRWLATIDKFADQPDGYDYWIPDTRDQESALWDLLAN